MDLPGFGALSGASSPSSAPRLATALGALGLGSPLARFAGVSAITAGLLYLAKPALFFDAGGLPRPWSVIRLTNGAGTNPTPVPFWLFSLFVGFLAATFI